ncbi:hypothetical protein AK830_g5058 [Neonectria ditissima]|uniref:CBM-cenC domain-containing protein n=1 Tax=Neonectria ditissima TaxID=78410 RepID=A0A0P7B657_9HYPO|nr:hypothetical protein AK830_g5058 [Neonectria ditissima]
MLSPRAITAFVAFLSVWGAHAAPCKPSLPSTTESATTTATDMTSTTVSTASATFTSGPVNGGFDTPDDDDNNYQTPWIFSDGGVDIVHDADEAKSGERYARFFMTEEMGWSPDMNQTLHGLDTSRLFRLSYSWRVTVPATEPVSEELREYYESVGTVQCRIEGVINEEIISVQPLPNTASDAWEDITFDFDVDVSDPGFSLRWRCNKYGFQSEVLIDDVTITAV